MLTKNITYRGYDDEEYTETFYFNLSRAELIMLESSKAGGMRSYYERIAQAKDQVAIMEAFRDLIRMSIGYKSPDGKRFVKSEEYAKDFEQSEAYSELIVELLSDAKTALAFIEGIMPAKITGSEEYAKERDKLAQLAKGNA